MIRCVRIGPELYVCARNFRLLSLLAHEAFSGASGSRTGRFNTISGYFAGYDRLHAFKARQNAIRERYSEISGE